MRWLLPLLFCTLCTPLSQGGQLPLTTKEVSLMLRSGYSSPTVMSELGKRHFAETLDADKEDALLKADASPELIAALKGGSYTLSVKDAADAREQLARHSVRTSMETERARKADAAFQAKVARDRSTAPITGLAGPNVIAEMVQGDLVRFNNGSVVHSDEEGLAGKKLVALYFSAHWCGPCRKFTPQLVDFYNRMAPQHPEFEILFVSDDRSAFGMQTYMRETGMPWPAIDFDKLPGKEAIRKYAGSGIPCLVLLDASGKVLSDSYAGKKYLGPEKVLADLDTMLSGQQVAQSR